jgi:predicted DNA-binding transcriptional regulator AlpA
MPTFDKPLTRSELARALGTTRQTLWNMQRRGELPAPTQVHPTRSEFSPSAQMIAADLIAGSRA